MKEPFKVVMEDPNLILEVLNLNSLKVFGHQRVFFLRTKKIILKTGKKFIFCTVMVLGIRVQEKIPFNTKTLSYILEVII